MLQKHEGRILAPGRPLPTPPLVGEDPNELAADIKWRVRGERSRTRSLSREEGGGRLDSLSHPSDPLPEPTSLPPSANRTYNRVHGILMD